MRKLWLIVKREYITRVRTKGFVIGTLIVPTIGAGFLMLIAFIAGHPSSQSIRLAVVDNAGGLTASLTRGLDAKLPNGQPVFVIDSSFDRPPSPDAIQEDLRAKVNSGALDAYLVVPADLSQSVELHTKNPSNLTLLRSVTGALNQAVIEARLRTRGIRVDDMPAIVRGPNLQVIRVSKSGESVDRGQTIGVAIGLVVLLYTSLLMYGIITMRSVLEEKTTRTMEILISAVRPSQLLAGKILGVAAVAFTQFLIWMTSLALLISYGAAMAVMSGSGSFLSGLHIPISLVIYAVIYFLGGYFLYSSMFAAIGAACSNEQDAQQLQWPATLPLVFCMLIYGLVLSDPMSRASFILSEIPFFAPVLMTLRISIQTPPFWQIALSIFLLIATTVGAVFVSAKIYRVGILMYGKRPTLPELVRWLRYS